MSKKLQLPKSMYESEPSILEFLSVLAILFSYRCTMNITENYSLSLLLQYIVIESNTNFKLNHPLQHSVGLVLTLYVDTLMRFSKVIIKHCFNNFGRKSECDGKSYEDEQN